METNNKASTSHVKSDSSDEDDQHHEKLSTEQLCLKFRNLSLENDESRNQVKNDSVKIDWLDMSQIDEILKKYKPGKKKILPSILQKWDPLDNISDPHSIVSNFILYKFDFLKYAEIKPDWWICYKNLKKDSGSVTSNSYQNFNDCSQTIIDTISEAIDIDYEFSEKGKNKNDKKLMTNWPTWTYLELNPEDENDIADIKTESRMDLGELKKEISDIIDEQCVETDSNNEWSSKLSFFKLIKMLHVNERDGLTISIVFVGLLHLANERGLKLFQEYCVINDIEETFIAKPINKE